METRSSWTNLGAHLLLRVMAANFNLRPALRKYLRGAEGWLNFSIALQTESGSVAQRIEFRDGRAYVSRGSGPATTTLIYKDEAVLRQMLSVPPNEVMTLLMRGRMRVEGNTNILSLFNFYLSLLLEKKYKQMLAAQRAKRAAGNGASPTPATLPPVHKPGPPLAAPPTEKTRYLTDPFLGQYALDDFPRLQTFLKAHFDTLPEICPERAALLTRWFKENGFEYDRAGQPWNPVLRQAQAFKYLMEHKEPLIREDDLLAGTTTTKDIGVVLYPDAHGELIWGELLTVQDRPLNPYRVSPETIRTLHDDVFPFWTRRTFREWVREKYDQPLCQRLDDRFAVYFLWKTVALSHTIPDFPKLLSLGARGLIAEIETEVRTNPGAEQKQQTLAALRLCLEGLITYSRHLALEARRQAARTPDPTRCAELGRLADICDRVPECPARTLHEALHTIWISWIGLHMENTNAGLSLGRLDQWLQPYFEADMAKLNSEAERAEYIRRAIEWVGCFYMRCTDHLPLVPDIGNYLFGGSSSDQAITVGGVTRSGQNAVNDMTYILLKVTEMLKIRDPNVNARYSLEHNSDAYLQRLCEVNLTTTATPSMHGDENVLRSIAHLGYAPEDARDWSATGCVEPTISGKHMGHTNSMMFSLVAALEMAINNGWHPLMDWRVGPQTGRPEAGAFPTFEDFFEAYRAQLAFLVEQAITYNRLLAEAHSVLRPTPLLSSLIEGPVQNGRDVTLGGAKYNSSGVACIGLTDVVDSLMAIRQLVYEEKSVDWAELKKALADNFAHFPDLHARTVKKVPKFGSGNAEALALAQRLTRAVHELFAAKRNFRGGPYTTGFWSMSNHVAFGTLAGALPSGRLAGKAFTPGLTPSPHATQNLLDNLRDVAALDPAQMDNNIAFNIKFVPKPGESRAQTVEHMRSYVKTYFELGGMQMQLNVVSSATLRDAMAHPDNYRDLLVRISGYNAYFVTLNRDMQVELIERAEYQ